MDRRWQSVEMTLKPSIPTVLPAAPDHWCRCGGAKTCIGCLILGLIQKHYGTGGVMYLLDAIKAGERSRSGQ